MSNKFKKLSLIVCVAITLFLLFLVISVKNKKKENEFEDALTSLIWGGISGLNYKGGGLINYHAELCKKATITSGKMSPEFENFDISCRYENAARNIKNIYTNKRRLLPLISKIENSCLSGVLASCDRFIMAIGLMNEDQYDLYLDKRKISINQNKTELDLVYCGSSIEQRLRNMGYEIELVVTCDSDSSMIDWYKSEIIQYQ